MSTDTLALIRDYLSKATSRDVEGAAAFFADDLVAHVLGRSSLAGEYSRDELQKVMNDMFASLDLSVDPVDVIAGDDHAVAVVRNIIRTPEQTYDGLRMVLYRIEDGKIRELWTFDEDQRAYDAVVDATLR